MYNAVFFYINVYDVYNLCDFRKVHIKRKYMDV